MNRAEFSELIEACGKDIYSFCVYLTQSRDEADELYQDTFLTAAENSRKLDISQNPKGWLISSAVKLWTNKKRKFARRMRLFLSVAEKNAGEIPTLPPAPRTAISNVRNVRRSSRQSGGFPKGRGYLSCCITPRKCRSRKYRRRWVSPKAR